MGLSRASIAPRPPHALYAIVSRKSLGLSRSYPASWIVRRRAQPGRGGFAFKAQPGCAFKSQPKLISHRAGAYLIYEVALMSIVIAISCGALPAAGALMALEERDVAPALAIARLGGALALGLSACGWRAADLERLARAFERNGLALLAQALPALSERALKRGPRSLAAMALGEGEGSCCERPPLAAPQDPIEALLSELTGGVMLRDVRAPLALPVRAYRLPGGAPELLISGRRARAGIALSTALRCAAFWPELAGAPVIGGAPLAAWPDARGDLAAWRRLGRGAPLISIASAGHVERGRSGARIDGVDISIPRPSPRCTVHERIQTGYDAVRARMSEVLSFC